MADADAATRAELHQQAQGNLAEAVALAVARAFVLVDQHALGDTLPQFKTAVAAIVGKFGQAAASLAIAHYLEARNAAKAAGLVAASSSFTVAPAGADILATSGLIDWATAGLWTPAGAAFNEADQAAAVTAALTKAQGVAESLAVTAGRTTTMNAIRRDTQAKGWARVPEAGACARCLMLAARGAVYKAEWTANFKAHHVQANGTGGECRCGVEPQFSSHYEPTAQVREAQKLWTESTKGLTGKDAELAFRRAVEKRGDSPLRRVTFDRPAPKVDLSPDAAARVSAQLEKALSTMRANNVRGQLDRAIAATEQRIAELASA